MSRFVSKVNLRYYPPGQLEPKDRIQSMEDVGVYMANLARETAPDRDEADRTCSLILARGVAVAPAADTAAGTARGARGARATGAAPAMADAEADMVTP